LRWPKSVAPYQLEILTITPARSPEVVAFADGVYEDLTSLGIEVLYDDRDLGPGVKFADADLIGIPTIVTIGQRGLANGVVEVKDRFSGERTEVGVPDLVSYLSKL
jgi:prolyl-tRNA synthetase